MALNQVNLVLDLYDGSGVPVTQGTVILTPNDIVKDAADHIAVTQFPVTVNLRNNPLPMVPLIATDNVALSPSGWGWTIQATFPGAPPRGLYLIPFSGGATQYFSALLPTGSVPAAFTQIPVTGTPSAGEIITATGPATADWQAPPSAGTGLAVTAVVTTTPVTAVASTFIPVDASGGNRTVNLPAAPPDGTVTGVKMIKTASANTVTVACGGSDVFNVSGGSASLTLSLLMQGVILQYKASGGIWYVSGDDLPLGQLDARYPQRAAGTASPAAPLPYFNPKDDGAVFNGATNDSAALATTVARGGTTQFPPGTAAVAGTVHFTQSGERIHGAGMYATTVKATAGLSSVLAEAATGYVSGVTLEDMTIDGGGLANVAIEAFGTSLGRLTVRRCRFINFPAGAIINAGFAAEFVIEDCEAEGGGLLKSAFFAGTIREIDSLILRRNKIRWVGNGVSLGDPGFHVAYAEIDDNDFEMGWMHARAIFSGSAGVTYSSNGLSDGGASFSGLAANQPVRAMPVLQTGTFTTVSGTHIADASASFTTTTPPVMRNHIVRSGTSFGVVSLVESATTLHVREWLDQATYLPVAPPASGAAYTVYGLLFLNRTSSTGTTITGQHGASGGGGGWYDLTGIESTPASGTLYEVPPLGNYQIFLTNVTDKLQITSNRLRGGWSDQVEHFSTRAVISGNIIEDGNNYGIFTGAPSGSPVLGKSVITGNLIKHNAIGLGVGNATDVEIGPNLYEDNGWGLPNVFPGLQVVIENSVRVTMTGGNATNTAECANTTAGLFIQGASLASCKVRGFTGSGHAAGDIRVQTTVPAGACELADVSGVITYVGTTNGQLLRVTGSGAPSLIASPGSTYLSTGGGAGTTLYVKETGNGSTGWTAFSTGGSGTPLGGQAAYAKITSTVTQVLAAGAWTAVTGAPSITLPNDGNTYRVSLSVSSVASTVAENLFIGIGTSTSAMLATSGVNVSVTNPYTGRAECQQVTGTGQTVTVYGWATSGTPTLSLTAGGATGSVCELAAYRVA